VIVPGLAGSVTSAGLALDESQGLSFAVSLLGRATAPSLGAPPGDIPAQALSSRGPTEADLVVDSAADLSVEGLVVDAVAAPG
jgi:hypothetical protein